MDPVDEGSGVHHFVLAGMVLSDLGLWFGLQDHAMKEKGNVVTVDDQAVP